MCDEFLNLFDEMLDNKEAIMKLKTLPQAFLGENLKI